MSNYYAYRDVKVMIAHKLMSMDGWKVYGYKEDNSDPMTDYFDPADWSGIAEKNGYILCVDVYGAAEPQEIREYNHDAFTYDMATQEKIKKLKCMTVSRGASEQEESSAKAAIRRLLKKAEESAENNKKYVVIGMIPGHMANPPRCNWHIEKDGIIIDKGNGLLKYARIDEFYKYPVYKKDLEDFRTLSREEYKAKIAAGLERYYSTMEALERCAESRVQEMEKKVALIGQFEALISKIDTTCGGLLGGNGEGYTYEKVKETKYKKELKAVESETGEIKEGQLFIINGRFTNGFSRGNIYRIHESVLENGNKLYYAYKLNGKLTKECTGRSVRGNCFLLPDADIFSKWIERKAIAWCEIQEVQTPYEVEKVVKRKIDAERKAPAATSDKSESLEDLHFIVKQDVDTRTNEKIFLVNVEERLSKEQYRSVNAYIKSIGGYYSRFKHAFLFREDPSEKLNVAAKAEAPEDSSEEPAEYKINFTVAEDQHTKTGAKIWIVKPETELSKDVFVKIKRKFATLDGYYSSFKHGFIFSYDPTEKLRIA